MAEGDTAASGGLLVVLGIIVALIAVYFFTQYDQPSTDITIRAELPANPAGNNNLAPAR